MKKLLYRWQFTGFLFTSILGTLLHFLFKWSGNSILFAPFSAVNESIWEHMKILFFPMFFFALTQHIFIGKEYSQFWFTKLKGILLGICLIPILYYSYTGIFGVFLDYINIFIFYFCAAITYITETRLLKPNTPNGIFSRVALIDLLLLTIVFVVFTFLPPHIPIFQDPQSMLYGIPCAPK